MKNKLSIFLIAFVLVACSKEDKSDSTLVITPPTGTPKEPSTFVFTGSMHVDKNDSNWVDISDYYVSGTVSKIFKGTSNYSLTTNFNATALKGETIHSIPVEIPNHYFSAYSDGTGIFNIGVIDGYYSSDSLYYHVLYQDADSNNIYLDFEGKLTDSY